MSTIGGICPLCGGRLRVERVRCHRCGTAIEGTLELSPLLALEPEQLRVVELLVKHRGNIRRVADELGVSHRTGRNRVDEVAEALGYSRTEPLPDQERRREILKALQEGRISADQAARMLREED